MLRVFSKDLLRYLPGQVGATLIALFAIPIFTRLLPAEQFGQYVLVMSSVTAAVSFFAWATPAIIRYYPSLNQEERQVMLRSSFWVHLILAATFAGMALALAQAFWRIDQSLLQLVAIGALTFFLQSLFNLMAGVLRARLQAGAYSFFNILAKASGVALGILLVTTSKLGAKGILLGAALGILSALPFLWKKVFHGIKAIGSVSLDRVKMLAFFGIPVVLGDVGSWVLSQSDRYLIQFYYGAREVGIYAVAYSLSQQSIMFLGLIFRLSSGPLLSNVWETQGKEASKRLLTAMTRLYLLVSIPALAGMSVLASPVMKLMAGSSFSAGYVVIPWVVSGAFFLGLESRFNHVLLLFKQSRIVMLATLATGALNVVLNWWLLPSCGYTVAAVNTLVCYLILCVLEAWISRRFLRWEFPWQTMIRSSLASGIMAVCLFFLLSSTRLLPVWTIGVAVPTGVLVYFLTMWALGEVSPTERKAIEGILKRRLPQRATL